MRKANQYNADGAQLSYRHVTGTHCMRTPAIAAPVAPACTPVLHGHRRHALSQLAQWGKAYADAELAELT